MSNEMRRRVEVIQTRVFRHPAIRSLNLGLARMLRPRLERSTPDATEALTAGSALIVAPHPDDESIGCGGLIAAKRARGEAVSIVVVTDGDRSHSSDLIDPVELASIRRAELIEAASTLGVSADDVHFLGFADRSVADRSAELVATLHGLIEAAAPDQLVIPSDLDANTDHRAVCAAGLQAAGAATKTPEVLSYLVWFWTPEAWVDQGASSFRKIGQLVTRIRAFVASDRLAFDPGDHAATKATAIRCHRSQLENLTGEPGWAVIEPEVLDLLVGRRELYVRRTNLSDLSPELLLNGASR